MNPQEAVVSGTIHDNPWNTVEIPSENRSLEHETSPRRRFVSCTDWTLHRLVQVGLAWDATVSGILLLYGVTLLFQRSTSISWWPALLLLESSAWLGIRALCVVGSLYYSHLFDRAGFLAASHVSVMGSVQALVLCIVCGVQRHSLSHASWWTLHWGIAPFLKWAHHSSWMTTWNQWLLHKVVPWLWLIFLVGALMEFPVRYVLYQQYRHRLLQQEEVDVQQTALLSRVNARRRPWWWTSANTPSASNRGNVSDLQQALLDDRRAAMDDDEEEVALTTTPSRNHHADHSNLNGLPDWARDGRSDYPPPPPPSSFFSTSWFFWKSSPTTPFSHNPRDDGSVDFASVQEEWASRSEEDPLWWSRGGGDPKPPSRRSARNQPPPDPRVPDFVSTTLDTDSVSAQSGTAFSTA